MRLGLLALLLTACVHRAPGSPPAPTPLELSWDVAWWSTGHGVVPSVAIVPLDVHNPGPRPVDLVGWDVDVRTADGRTCPARANETVRLAPGDRVRLLLVGECRDAGGRPMDGLGLAGDLRVLRDGRPERITLQGQVGVVG